MANITFLEIKDWEKNYIKKGLNKVLKDRSKTAKSYKLNFYPGNINDIAMSKLKTTEILSVFIYSKLDKNILSKLPRLKAIATRSTGYDHIDIDYCRKNNIKVYNVPFYGENTVAEHTFALILSLSRNVHKSYVRTLRDDFSIEGLTGFDLKGKTIGIIGSGHIGMHVAKIAKGFGMNVLVYDVNKQKIFAEVLGFEYKPFEYVLKYSDIITLHVPYNKHTHHLINMDNIKLIKKGAILINTSRGSVVDTNALLYALNKKILGGAGLDVIEGEELIKEEKQLLHDDKNIDKWKTIVRDHEIFRMDNVVFTPHNAFNSIEALHRILDTTIKNINDFILKEKNNNLVN